MGKRLKQGSKLSSSPLSAHAKIMERKRNRERWLTGILGLVVLGVIAGVIWFFVSQENIEEDYSIVGQGEPVIVQVHQLNCADCDVLRANAKRALAEIDDDRLQYRMAYLHKSEGIAFASKHGAARYTTLILFDKFGRKKGVYVGLQDVDQLVDLFEGLL